MAVIGIDFDDVLFKTADKTVELYNQAYGTSLSRENWYDFQPLTPWGTEVYGEAVRRVVALMSSASFVNLTPMENAQRVLRSLQQHGHRLIVLTGRPESMRAMTLAALDESFAGLFSDETLFFTNHFGQAHERVTKGSIATQLGMTHFIDDQIEHVNDVQSVGVQSFLFSDQYKWNQSQPSDGVIRVTSWKDVEEYFNESK